MESTEGCASPLASKDQQMKQATRPIFCLLSIVVLLSSAVHARSWRVERDGSGDYTEIQPALDVAAPGDTLLLGPGRFTETHVVEAPYDTGDVYIEVSVESISIIGSGAEMTIIGSIDADKRSDHWPKGVFGWPSAGGLRLEDLALENMRDGVCLHYGATVNRCLLTNNIDAMIFELYGGDVHIKETSYIDNADHGIFAYGTCSKFVVEGCSFADNNGGISVISMDSMLVSDCTFENHVVSIQYDHCQGEIRECAFSGGVNVDVSSIGSHLFLNDCRFSSAYTAIVANTWGYVRGQGNIIPPGEGERVYSAGTSFYFNNNHIIRGEGMCVRLGGYVHPPADVLDFTNNYWGTTEADSISAWIWDQNDDSHVQGEVVFEPFSPVPLPDEKKSLGDVKRMFR